MQAASAPASVSMSVTSVRLGRAISWLTGLFLLVDSLGKFVRPAQVVEGTVKLGYPESVLIPLGIVLSIATLLYLVPRTAVLGAILLTGYLGGAVATHVRVGGPVFNVMFAFTFGVLVWAGLWFRDPTLRRMLPLRN